MRYWIVIFSLMCAVLHAETKVVFLGESFSNVTNSEGINKKVLGKLLEDIKKEKPQAIFFAGNLVFGYDDRVEKHPAQKRNRYDRSMPFLQEPINNNWVRRGYVYDRERFLLQLQAFSDLIKEKIQGEIPIYPIAGSHEVISKDSEELFHQHFGLKNEAPSRIDVLAYGVSMGDAYFLLLPTSVYDPRENKTIEHSFSSQYLDWIDDTLKEASKKHQYLFVIGNKPAFSTTATYGYYRGLEKVASRRDRFWNVLKRNKVLAYISGYESLYDRSKRQGVWQVITGGAGAPFSELFQGDTFNHFLLLTIPDSGDPKIRVIDIDGNTQDEFILESRPSPLYQLRISGTK